MAEEKVSVPSELGERGAAFWSALQSEFEFDTKESELLLESCRVLDLIDQLQVAVEQGGAMIPGSKGQDVVNPAIGELRQQQVTFARLSALLRLPADEAAAERFRLARAHAGAEGRWLRAVH